MNYKYLKLEKIFSFIVIGILIFGSVYQRNWHLSSKDKVTLANKKGVSRRLVNTILVLLFCIISLIISILLY